jgi:hypothetical protein
MTNKEQNNPTSAQSRNASTERPNTSDRTFTVSMHRDLVDELDEGFSPLDGILAIDEMFSELPLLHRTLAPRRLRRRAGRKLKVYRGCYDWYPSLGFSYVQIGTTLHVLELWYRENPDLSEIDIILGTGKTEGYTHFETAPGHSTDADQEDPSLICF